jgi:hypothetical protein
MKAVQELLDRSKLLDGHADPMSALQIAVLGGSGGWHCECDREHN